MATVTAFIGAPASFRTVPLIAAAPCAPTGAALPTRVATTAASAYTALLAPDRVGLRDVPSSAPRDALRRPASAMRSPTRDAFTIRLLPRPRWRRPTTNARARAAYDSATTCRHAPAQSGGGGTAPPGARERRGSRRSRSGAAPTPNQQSELGVGEARCVCDHRVARSVVSIAVHAM